MARPVLVGSLCWITKCQPRARISFNALDIEPNRGIRTNKFVAVSSVEIERSN